MFSILVVDDEPFQRLLVREILVACPDLSILEAADGKQALEVARTKRPDLVVLDIMMPELDGYQVCKIIRGDLNLTSTRIIYCTALRLADLGPDRIACADDFITKPPEESELLQKIGKLLNIEVDSGSA